MPLITADVSGMTKSLAGRIKLIMECIWICCHPGFSTSLYGTLKKEKLQKHFFVFQMQNGRKVFGIKEDGNLCFEGIFVIGESSLLSKIKEEE